MTAVEKKSFIKETANEFMKEIKEKGCIKFSQIKEKCTFKNDVKYDMVRSIEWIISQYFDLNKVIVEN